MEKIFSRFMVSVWLTAIWPAGLLIHAQVPVPEVKNVLKDIFVSLPNNSGSVNITIDDYPFGIDMAPIGFNQDLLPATLYQPLFILPGNINGRITGLSRKTGAGNASMFYILLDDGSVYLSSVTGATSVSQPVLLGRDTLNYGSYNFGKLKGDALYWLNSNYVDVSRDGGATWQTDSAGMGGQLIYDFDIDAGQSVYAVTSNNVYKQSPSSNTWSLTSFTGGLSPTSIFVENDSYILVGTSYLGVYYSTDTGHTWLHSTSGLNSVDCGKFCQDVMGNIYMLSNAGSEMYRSIDNGVDWVRIDSAITGLEKDPNYTGIINDISADSVLCAATIYGIFASADQGNTWTPVNNGLPETKFNGFWKNSTGRLLEASNNGLFYRNATDTVFTKILPATGYAYAGPLFEDVLGNTYTRVDGGAPNTTKVILKSTDQGSTWQADTSGLWQITNETAFGVDEYGYEHIADNVSINQTIVYNKIPGASFLPDTGGIGTSLGTFSTVNVFASDGSGGSGYIYLAGNMGVNPCCWRRITGGGNWSPDTAGLPPGTVLQLLTHDVQHNMVASALLPAPVLYIRQGGTWASIPFPPSLTGYVTISAIATDNVNGILVAFNTYTTGTNDIIGLGIYCTHNLGTNWNLVGLKGAAVYNMVTVGDTIYALSNRGIYGLTCNGVVNDPTITGISEPSSSGDGQLHIFPNPATNICYALFTPATGKSELSILDVTGRPVRTYIANAGAGEFTFDIAGLSRGIYFCLLRNDEKIVAVRKLVVQ